MQPVMTSDRAEGEVGPRRAEIWRKRLLLAAKLAVSIALLVWLLTVKIDLGDAVRRIAAIPPLDLGFAFGGCILSYVLIMLRWRLILGALGIRLRMIDAWSITWIGVFFNQALPSNVAGDVMRVWRVLSHGAAMGRAVSSVMIDRVAALLGLAALVMLGLPLSFDLIGPGPTWYALVGLGGAIFAGVVALLAFDRIVTPLGRMLPARLVNAARALVNDSRAAILHARIGPSVVVLSMVNMTVATGIVWALADGLGISVGFGDLLTLFPPVLLVSMLPVSFAGWGVRELAMVTALGFIGVPDVQAVALSLAFGLTLLASALPGGLVWFFTGNRRRPV